METTNAPAAVATPRPPLNPRFVWVAIIVAASLPVITLATFLVLLASANYNFLEWME